MMSLTTRLGRGLAALALLSAAWTAAVVAAGGFDLRPLGIPVVARTPWPTAVVAAVLAGALVLFRRGAWREDVAGAACTRVARAGWVAAAAAVLALVLAIRFGTFAAGGSDSYCYVEQAERMAAGTLLQPVSFGFHTPWEQAALSLTPTGFVPSRVVPGAIAPICPAGLALAMAAPRLLGAPREAVFLVVPAMAAIAVWASFLVGRRLAGPAAGAATAAVTAASPVFLFQALQPMSDVPATACWLAALALAGRRGRVGFALAGVSAGLASAMRPNLAPLCALLAPYAALALDGEARSMPARAGRVAWLVLGVAPAAIAIAGLQHALYGSPLSSGYGSLEALFSLANVGPNLRRYVPWLVETQSPAILLAALAPFVARRLASTSEAAYAGLVALFAAGVLVAYLPYVPFDQWWFLRFWLPAIPALVALSAAVAGWGHRRAMGVTRLRSWAWASTPLSIVGVTALCAWQLGVARDRGVFGLAEAERRFVVAGRYVGASLPGQAVVLTIWHSGSVRYYGERPSLVWDAIAPGELALVLDSLRSQGRVPYLLLEDWEREPFRARFRDAPIAALDWPPLARIGRTVSIWAIDDRDRFLRGEPVTSERVWVP